MELVCNKISVSLGGREIVKAAQIEAADKQFIGIIGPNGSGKSTLLKCIYRIIKPTSGAIFIDNKPMQYMTFKESAKKMAVVSQHNYYNFDFTVHEVVLMGRSPHKRQMERDNEQDYAIVSDALRKVEMESYSDRVFSTLSGGEQQRIILARALAQKTECLILDEPTNHLDIKYQFQILNLVKSLGITVISALHDLNLAALYCDYIYVLKDGEIRASGAPNEILTVGLLKEIYEIDACIVTNATTGRINVVFNP